MMVKAEFITLLFNYTGHTGHTVLYNHILSKRLNIGTEKIIQRRFIYGKIIKILCQIEDGVGTKFRPGDWNVSSIFSPIKYQNNISLLYSISKFILFLEPTKLRTIYSIIIYTIVLYKYILFS